MNEIVSRQQLEQQANRVPGATQATAIEHSRAIAEVQAAVAVAQRFPRNPAWAMQQALEACGQTSLAERAFYSFPRGGQSVNGPSIALAVELARCWGNINYGIMELERDDEAGHTEMLAFAWDIQTNTRSSQAFKVPHSRDTKQGRKPLTDMRDIYENNANNGARRLRECIFRVLPTYLRSAAEDRCRKVLEKGEGDMPLPLRISRSIEAFAGIGVSLERLELRQGSSKNWTPVDLANLHILFQSISHGETTIEEAFAKEGTGETASQVRRLAKDKPGKQEPQQSKNEAPETGETGQTEQGPERADLDGPLEGAIEPAAPDAEPKPQSEDMLKRYVRIQQQVLNAGTLAAVNIANQAWGAIMEEYDEVHQSAMLDIIHEAYERVNGKST